MGRRRTSRDRPSKGAPQPERGAPGNGVGRDLRGRGGSRDRVDPPRSILRGSPSVHLGVAERRGRHLDAGGGTGVTLWVLLRAAGIGAYVALFLSVVWGLVSTTGVITKRVSRPAGNHFHAVVAATGLVLLGAHLMLLVMHAYIPFGVLDV